MGCVASKPTASSRRRRGGAKRRALGSIGAPGEEDSQRHSLSMEGSAPTASRGTAADSDPTAFSSIHPSQSTASAENHCESTGPSRATESFQDELKLSVLTNCRRRGNIPQVVSHHPHRSTPTPPHVQDTSISTSATNSSSGEVQDNQSHPGALIHPSLSNLSAYAKTKTGPSLSRSTSRLRSTQGESWGQDDDASFFFNSDGVETPESSPFSHSHNPGGVQSPMQPAQNPFAPRILPAQIPRDNSGNTRGGLSGNTRGGMSYGSLETPRPRKQKSREQVPTPASLDADADVRSTSSSSGHAGAEPEDVLWWMALWGPKDLALSSRHDPTDVFCPEGAKVGDKTASAVSTWLQNVEPVTVDQQL